MAVSRKPAKPAAVVSKPVGAKPAEVKSMEAKPEAKLEKPETKPVAAKPAPEAVAATPAQTQSFQPAKAPEVATDILQAAAVPVANLQEMLRVATESSVERSKLAYERMRSSAEETTETLESAFKVASDGSTAISNKAIDLLRLNANSFFDLAKSLTEAKSLSDVVVLQTQFARTQFETFSAQAKEISGLVQKVATDTAAPLNAAAVRTFGSRPDLAA